MVDGDSHTAPVRFDAEADAWAWLATVEADVARGVWRPVGRSTVTLDRFAREWIDTHPTLKASTRGLYAGDYERHLSPYLGHLAVPQITPPLVRTWRARLAADLREAAEGKRAAQAARADAAAKRAGAAARKRGATAAEVEAAEVAERRRHTPRQATRQDGSATVARAFRLLRAILNGAVGDGLIATNPCAGMGAAGRADDDATERPTLSAAEVGALADAVPDRYRALVLLLAWGALRLGEACALRRADVDLTPGAERVRVSERIYWLDAERRWDFAPPKSRAGRRVVPLPRHVAEALADHLGRFTGPDAGSLVFVTSTGKPALRVAQLAITRRLDALGRNDVRVHDLRHTGQLLAAVAGATPAELQRRMGHSSAVAAARYSHTAEDHGRAVADALADVATGATVVPLASRRRRAVGEG